MKSQLPALLCVCLFMLFSCKKERQNAGNINNKAEKKYPVSFNVSGFKQTQTTISLKNGKHKLMSTGKKLTATDSTSLNDAFVDYAYVVYDASGKEVSRIFKQGFGDQENKNYEYRYIYTPAPSVKRLYTGPNSFGTIQDSLAAGNYTVVVITGVDFNVNAIGPFSPDSIRFKPLSSAAAYSAPGFKIDAFFKKIDITVGTGPLNQNITLDRVSGQLQIIIKDTPPNGYTLQTDIKYDNRAFAFSTETPFCNDELNYGLSLLNPVNTISIHNTTSPMTITMGAYDQSGNLLASKTINNVRVYKNTRTILSGNLFTPSGPGATQFTITANQAWDPDVTTVHF
ncbi:hypothetical protein [Mucilaginibacter aquariorum]|uniref:FimB/Mfa2 family fimbrial subunit n=1 Tax=Mucilaginibacter aquariorum TaxID=2967225 RepID=A0ABT1SZ26_9SPHI|nr:hypothetical protein [Mucilaginibacter aquariorum]MCQ6957587.1 hypothetical protein [Mucilaginibacter aquariorum]